MKETRRAQIRDKVFTKEDIRNIWRLLNKEHLSEDKDSGPSLNLEIHSEDGSSYESDSDDLLEDGDIIDTKRCKSINMEFRGYKSGKLNAEKRICISLKHGFSDNGIIVSGNDKNWVSGTFEKIKTVIEAVTPQQHWFIEYRVYILHIGAILVGLILNRILDIFLTPNVKPIENPSEIFKTIRDIMLMFPFLKWLLLGTICWVSGILPVLQLRNWVLKLWPNIEFDFGPEHQKLEKNKRNRLQVFFLIIIVPLITSFIYDLIKK